MNDDYEIPDDSELTEQERVEHSFIVQYLDYEELMSVALACARVEDVIAAQLYFARAKLEGSREELRLLSEIEEGGLRIKGLKLGIPDFEFYS